MGAGDARRGVSDSYRWASTFDGKCGPPGTEPVTKVVKFRFIFCEMMSLRSAGTLEYSKITSEE